MSEGKAELTDHGMVHSQCQQGASPEVPSLSLVVEAALLGLGLHICKVGLLLYTVTASLKNLI